MALREFFKPTSKKILVAGILYLFLLQTLTYSLLIIDCFEPPCKNEAIENFGAMINFPSVFITKTFFTQPDFYETFPFPIDFILVIGNLYLLPLLWSYLLACIIISMYQAVRSKTRRASDNRKMK